MPDTKISALTNGAPVQSTDKVPVARGAGNVFFDIAALENYLNTNLFDRYANYAALPAATGSGIITQVMTTTGLIGFRNLAGMYHDAGAGTWNYLGLYGRAAVEIANTPAGTIAATDVQAALNELDGDIETHKASGGAHHLAVTGAVNGFMIAADKTKLDGIAAGATANATDASLRDRTTHTGTQLAITISNFDEAAQDAVANALLDTSTIDLVYDDALATISAAIKAASVGLSLLSATGIPNNTTFLRGDNTWAVPSGGVSDGDKGDITVSGGGTAWVVDPGAITLAKQADMNTASVVYRKSVGAGPPEVQTLATLKTDLLLTGTNSGDQTSIVGITGTKAQFDTAVTDGNLLYVGDVTQYTDEQAQDAVGLLVGAGLTYNDTTGAVGRAALTGDVTAGADGNATTIAADAVTNSKLSNVNSATFKGRVTAAAGDPEDLTGTQATTILDTFTIALKGLVPASGGGTTNFMRADGTWAAPGGGGGSGDVVGPASATDNAIARFNTATGKLIQNSVATVGDNGDIASTTNSGANPVRVPLVNWVMLSANYTLGNVATEQKLFNTTANGTLTIPTGVYRFECFLLITAMSATSGNAAFDFVGAGTAVTDRVGGHVVGIDNTNTVNVAGTPTASGINGQQTTASMVTASTGTGLRANISGMFRVSTAGTIIPSITLVTAAAAIVQVGSYFVIQKIGESGETSVGAWS